MKEKSKCCNQKIELAGGDFTSKGHIFRHRCSKCKKEIKK